MVVAIWPTNGKTKDISPIPIQGIFYPARIGSQRVQVGETVALQVAIQGLQVDWVGMESDEHGKGASRVVG